MARITASNAEITRWLSSGGRLGMNQFTYSLPTSTSTWPGYSATSEPSNSYGIPTAALSTAFRAAMGIWDGLIAPNFAEIADNSSSRGEIRVAFSDLPSGVAGWSHGAMTTAPGTAVADIWIDSGSDRSLFLQGDYMFEVLLHEIGHSIGLKHSFESPAAPADMDNRRYTIMSYTDPVERLISLYPSGSNYGMTVGSVVEKTPMVLDIAAIQAIYGPDLTTRAGATTYTFTQADAALQTIYDAGGNDTIDLSNFSRGSNVDLNPGTYSSIGKWSVSEQVAYYSTLWPAYAKAIAADFAVGVVYTWTDNLGIAFSTIIENATGGSGNDLLIGNAVANLLIGNDGSDTLVGGAGADTLIGGVGNDSLDGGSGDDLLIVDDAGDAVAEAPGGGYDIVEVRAPNYLLGGGTEVEELRAAIGTIPINIAGNEFSQTITGNNSDNIINGGGGLDTLVGLGGNDTFLVRGPGDVVIEANGGGRDTVFTTVSYNLGVNEIEVLSTVENAATDNINLIGNFATQLVIGNYGNNILNGGSGGLDTLIGLRGDDIYAVGDARVVVVENAGEGTDTVVASVDYQLAAGVSVEVLAAQNRGGTEALTLRGNELAQTVVGNDGANIIDGGAGADALVGGGGADRFAFTTALGNGNVDAIVDFAAGTDRIQLSSAIFGAVGTSVTAAGFVTGTAATTADQHIVYNATTGQIFYDADGSGAGAAILFATVAAGTQLSAASFEVAAPTVIG